MTSLITTALLLGIAISLEYNPIIAGTIAPSEMASRNLFAADLFSVIVNKKSNENVVYSPASIQTCLSLAYTGAEGETAEEMRKVLKLGNGDKTHVAQTYGEFLKTDFKQSKSADAPQLRMANRMYVNEKIKILPQFNKIAQDYYETQAVNVDFSQSAKVVQEINNWVEKETENKIKNLMSPDAVDGDTSAVLVNAIYFKAKWENPFSKDITRKSTFHINKKDTKEIDFMYNEDDTFAYAALPQLEATALEMPYKDSDISMLIILPDAVDGLEKLESKLKGIDLNDISSKLQMTDIKVYLPKFRIEFDIDLKEPLQKLGLPSMFSDKANFSGMFESPHKISDAKHKAFLDVNEAGSEAAAATVFKIVPMSLILDMPQFRADHPFVFAIRSKATVYFAGHVAKF